MQPTTPTHLFERAALTALAFLSLMLTTPAAAVDSNASLRLTPGLASVTVFERTGGTGPTAYTFATASSQLTTRRADPLGPANSDISTAGSEYYDVYYSNGDGTFNLNGGFITVEAVFAGTVVTNGGLNLAEVRLNFSNGSSQLAQGVSSFLRMGVNSYPDRVPSAVDGAFGTHTAMGNTSGSSQRLRVTVSFHDATPLSQKANLASITLFERTGGSAPDPYTFGVASTTLLGRLSDPLTGSNSDFSTAASEFYDVYYSNGDGTPNANGAFLTIEALYDGTAPTNGGLNVAGARLNFSDGSTRAATGVASFLRLGGNSDPDRVPSAVDATLSTHTSMGNTFGQSGRLRLTLGF
jgi:hypothetical protein